jgi:hypothetical protein
VADSGCPAEATIGTRKSGPSFSAAPGCSRPPRQRASASARRSGTNTSFTSMSLLPVPTMPMAYHVSMIL